MFVDSEEYTRRKNTPFVAPSITLAELRASIPSHLFKRSTSTAAVYIARDVVVCYAFYRAILYIDAAPLSPLSLLGVTTTNETNARVLSALIRALAWLAYWWWQGLAFTTFWVIGHEAGHGSLSDYQPFNAVVGFCSHTFVLTPYYSWRRSHHSHHKATGSIENDESWVPRTRTDYNLPDASSATPVDYSEAFDETPAWTLARLFVMQALGLQAYFLFNTLGSPAYSAGTNHFSPWSPLFRPSDRLFIALTDVGLVAMACALYQYGALHGSWLVIKLYVVPWLIVNHWIVFLTFLHHTDPTVPHYRAPEWTYVRGALATVDRPLLGWMGKFFLHNVCHDHIVHHLFPSIPFFNLPGATRAIRSVLGPHYNYDSSNTLWALYRSFTQCVFIEDRDAIAFYKGRDGKAVRIVAVAPMDSGNGDDEVPKE